MNQQIDIKNIADKIAALNYIKHLKPSGFGFGGFQQQVSNQTNLKSYIKSADDICDEVFNQLSISRELVLMCLNLCFDNISIDTDIDLAMIDENKINIIIKTLQALLPKSYVI